MKTLTCAISVGLVVMAILWLWISVPQGAACNVPVFRYALERWPSDPFEAAVFHRGGLSAEAQGVVDWLKGCATGEEAVLANLLLTTIDLTEHKDLDTTQIWGDRAEPALPYLCVRYPRYSRIPGNVWEGSFSMKAAKALVDSPARREIAKRILGGDAAVWILLESGNREADDAAAKKLGGILDKVAGDLLLPPSVEDLYAAQYGGLTAAGYSEVDVTSANGGAAGEAPGEEPVAEQEPVGEKPSFSVIRVSRRDPAEAFLVNVLLGSEPDLRKYEEPMAFPVFGRGRVLYALVGKGITEDNVYEASTFLVGPCSCQIKQLNPGVDLLMPIDWDAGLEESFAEEDELPPLTGLAGMEPEVAVEQETADVEEAAPSVVEPEPDKTAAPAPAVIPPTETLEKAPPSSRLYATIAGAGVAVIVLMAVGTFVVLRRRPH